MENLDSKTVRDFMVFVAQHVSSVKLGQVKGATSERIGGGCNQLGLLLLLCSKLSKEHYYSETYFLFYLLHIFGHVVLCLPPVPLNITRKSLIELQTRGFPDGSYLYQLSIIYDCQAREIMFLVASVCPSVCSSIRVCVYLSSPVSH